MISSIIGQRRATKILSNAISSSRVANSYLFYGPDGSGKFTAALEFCMALNCKSNNKPCQKCDSCLKFKNLNHPDLTYIFPTPNLEISLEGNAKKGTFLQEIDKYKTNRIETPFAKFFFSANTEIRVDVVHMVSHRNSFSRNEADVKIVLIEDCDQMNIAAQNAFLKTLEEPAEDVVIVMTTTNIDILLSTIVSRCQRIPFYALSQKIVEEFLNKNWQALSGRARIAARLAGGNMGKAIRYLEKEDEGPKDFALNLIRLAVKKQDAEFLQMVAKSPIKREPEWFNEVLTQLTLWLYDISFQKTNPKQILNVDKLEQIDQISRVCPRILQEADGIVESIQRKKPLLKNNINQALLLTTIYAKITRLAE